MSERTYFSAEQEPDPDERRSGRLIPWMFVAAFLLVAAVNAIMIIFAETTFTGVTSEHPYEEGVTYDKVLAEGRRETELGWHADVAFAAKTKDDIKLAVTLRDREGDARYYQKGGWHLDAWLRGRCLWLHPPFGSPV